MANEIPYKRNFILKPLRVTNEGVVIFTDDGTNEIVPNEAQCLGYGYQYDRATRTCRAYHYKNSLPNQVRNELNKVRGIENFLGIGTNNSYIQGNSNSIINNNRNILIDGEHNRVEPLINNSSVMGVKGNSLASNTFTLGGNQATDLVGERQVTYVMYGKKTDDGVAVASDMNNLSGSLYPVPLNAGVYVHCDILAIRVGGTATGTIGDFASWTERGVGLNRAGEASMTRVRESIVSSGTTTGWEPTAVISLDGDFGITVQGAANMDIEWVITARITQLLTDSLAIPPPPSWSNTYSVLFDGVDDYCLTDSGFYLAASTSTTSMWFKLNGEGGASTGNNILYSATAPSDCLIWLWAAGATSYIRVYHPLYGSVIVWGWGITNPDEWHHIVITYNQSAGEMKIYGDGDLKSTTTATVAVHSGYSPAYIGRIPASTWGIFGGWIDEVGNWSSTLSADEVTAIYNSGTPTNLSVDAGDYESSANLDGYWRMGDPDGTSEYPTITDESGEGNDSTMTNMASGDIVEEVPPE
jgi:hypothetical protein